MTSLFQQFMGEAARLTQQGDLQQATAAIQRALGATAFGGPAPGASNDAQAEAGSDLRRETRSETRRDASPHGRQHTRQKTLDADVMDVQARALHPDERGVDRPADMPADVPADVPPEGQVVRGTFRGAGGARDWRLYVPPGDAGQPRPLVVMLHGCTQDADDFAAGTAMDEAAREQGFYVLYPEQSQRANGHRCWNWFKHSHQQRGKGEPALLAGLTREVMAAHAIDPRRVYVAGLSAGGAMAAILGEAYPDLYAAVGVHSGLAAGAANDLPSALAAMKGGAADGPLSHGLAGLPGMGGLKQARAPARARAPREAGPRTPTIVFHGDRDSTVHPVNGEHIVTACTMPAANEPATCFTEERARTPHGRAYTRRMHTDAEGQPLAEHWVVHGGGHAWSGGRAQGSYTDVGGPDASAAMVRFFFTHQRAGH